VGSARAFTGDYLNEGNECFIGANINNRFKSFCNTSEIQNLSVTSKRKVFSF
jgi:hypothetical protein